MNMPFSLGSDPSARVPPNRVRGRIFLVDDDEIIADLVKEALGSARLGVGWLSDGKRAFDLILRRPPDLVILDCNMPGMSGMELLRKMRLSPQLYELPVLMLTGRQSESDERIVRYEGADDYLRKPFDPAELLSRAEILIDDARRRAQMNAARPILRC